MILNQPPTSAPYLTCEKLAGNLVAQAVYEAVEKSPERFELYSEDSGIEVRVVALLPNGLPNRARMKIFSPRPGHTLVFFYKKSLVPYSRDRYSYGGIELRTAQVSEDEIAAWLAFLASGFHPDRRPARFRRAFPYDIPE